MPGVVWPLAPPRPPPGRVDDLRAGNERRGVRIDEETNRNGSGAALDVQRAVWAIRDVVGYD